MFINRELSALAFNLRILGEVQDAALPTYERVRFLSIASANLDEFFMVRVAGIKQQLASGVTATEADGLSPTEQFQAITAEVREMVRLFDAVWRDELVPLLRSHGLEILAPDALDRPQRDAAREHFRSVVFPILGNLAYWNRRPLRWDPAEWRFVGDDEANRKWLDRERRDAWPLPQV